MESFCFLLSHFFMAAPLALLANRQLQKFRLNPFPIHLPDLYLGEASCSCQFQGTYFCLLARNSWGRPMLRTRRRNFWNRPDGHSFRDGPNLYAWSYAHTVRVDKFDNIWAADKGFGHGRQVQSGWPGLHGFRRKQEASDERN